MKVSSLALIILFLVACRPITGVAQKKGEDIVFDGTHKPFAKFKHQYIIYKPESKETKGQPLIVYLHDNLSVGDKLDFIRTKGLPKMIEDGKKIPAVIIAPQLPHNIGMSWNPVFVDEFIQHVVKTYKIDTSRIYLTGISMGATGTWDYGIKYPSKLACAVPIAGWGNPSLVCKMKSVPTWIFHGREDQIVIPHASRSMRDALRGCGGDVRLTELEGVQHEAWSQAYGYDGLFEWMTSQIRSDSSRKKVTKVIDKNTVANKLPKALGSITGLMAGPEWDFFGINEKAALPVIINFDTTGRVKKMIRVLNAPSISWQDISRSADGNVYIADVGNENLKRINFQLYKIDEKELSGTTVKASKIEFTINPPTFLQFRSSFLSGDNLYLIGQTSNREFQLVKVPLKEGSKTEGTIVGSLPNIKMNGITSSYFDAGTSSLYLLNGSTVAYTRNLQDIELLKTQTFTYVRLPYLSQKECMTMLPSGKLAFADQNFLGTIDGNLYRMRLE